jgi:hypothetical protein
MEKSKQKEIMKRKLKKGGEKKGTEIKVITRQGHIVTDLSSLFSIGRTV